MPQHSGKRCCCSTLNPRRSYPTNFVCLLTHKSRAVGTAEPNGANLEISLRGFCLDLSYLVAHSVPSFSKIVDRSQGVRRGVAIWSMRGKIDESTNERDRFAVTTLISSGARCCLLLLLRFSIYQEVSSVRRCRCSWVLVVIVDEVSSLEESAGKYSATADGFPPQSTEVEPEKKCAAEAVIPNGFRQRSSYFRLRLQGVPR